uniref:MazG nucleotide pyrophosphohydrolase n=1 Tax=uncultured marine virus TaxID=186617 RepID=A0A0F7LC05_9VIRU|nr:MazG nucleotide pyrophosphohydrolase [uncultured marine virus]
MANTNPYLGSNLVENMKLSAEDVFGQEPALERLCEELDSMYPPLNPSPKDDDRMIMFRAGQRSVVEYIKAKNENV